MIARPIRRPRIDISKMSIEQQVDLGFLDPADAPRAQNPIPESMMWDSCGRFHLLPDGTPNPDWDPFEDPPDVRAKVLAEREKDRAKLEAKKSAIDKRMPRRTPKPPPPPPPGMGMPEARFSEMPAEPTKKADHNARSKAHLERQGYVYQRADYYDARTGRSHDLFGVFDAVAFAPGKGIVGVQLTSKANITTRKAKIRNWAGFAKWIGAGGSVLVLGWEKEGNRYVPHEAWMRAVTD